MPHPLHTIFAPLAALALLAACDEPTPRGAALSAAPSVLRADAEQAFREGRYAAAYARYMRLADGGDASSARVALAMLHEGRALFGSEWSAAPSQQRRWAQLAAQARGEILDSDAGD